MPTTPTRQTGSPALTFRLEGSEIVQKTSNGEIRFDPLTFGAFTRGSLVVRACRIPGPFKVGTETCRNGYLVWDGRLKAISADTFTLDYKPLHVDPNPEDADIPGNWETAA